MSQTKVCTKCQVEKSLDEFYLNANMRDGRWAADYVEKHRCH